MPRVQKLTSSTISQDSIAGFRKASQASVRSVSDKVGELATVQANSSAIARKLYAVLPRFISNAKQWVMNEQVAAVYGGAGMEVDTALATLAQSSDTWVRFIKAFEPLTGGSGLIYPNADSHMSLHETYSVWRAPQAGDYEFCAYLECNSSDTVGDNFIVVALSMGAANTNDWLTPIRFAGGVNTAINGGQVLIATGSQVLRLPRGGRVKFSLNQIGRSGTHATLTSVDFRISVKKIKFYPTLNT